MNGKVETPRWPPLGATRQRLQYAPIAAVLGAPQVPELAGKRMFYYVYLDPSSGLTGIALAALQTLEALIQVDRDFWLTCVLGEADVAVAGGSSFSLQLWDQGISDEFTVAGNRRDSHTFQNKKSVPQLVGTANAQEPGLLLQPHFIPASHPVALRVTNLANAANVVRIVLHGYVHAPLRGGEDVPGIPLVSEAATPRDLPPNLP